MQLEIRTVGNLICKKHYEDWIEILYSKRYDLKVGNVGFINEAQSQPDKDYQGNNTSSLLVDEEPIYDDDSTDILCSELVDAAPCVEQARDFVGTMDNVARDESERGTVAETIPIIDYEVY